MKFILSIVTVFLLAAALPAHGQVRFLPVVESSKLWIDGIASPVNFTCTADSLAGFGIVRTPRIMDSDIPIVTEQTDTEIIIRIPVRGMNCGRERMNRDFRNALKADRHGEIIFRFNFAERINGGGETATFKVVGNLTVAGVTREVEIDITGTQMDLDQFRIKGSRTIRMTDFEIDPPTAMMGLIQTRDELTVNFDILVEPEDTP